MLCGSRGAGFFVLLMFAYICLCWQLLLAANCFILLLSAHNFLAHFFPLLILISLFRTAAEIIIYLDHQPPTYHLQK